MTDQRARHVERVVAVAIHDARCGPASAHRTAKVYERCIDFYADHAALAVGALWEAGYLTLDDSGMVARLVPNREV